MSLAILVENDLGIVTEIVTFDLTVTETHEGVSMLTQFPVEVGADVADHMRAAPQIFAAEVFMTNHPTQPNLFKFRGRYEFTPLNLPVPFQFPKLFKGPLIASPGAGTRAAVNAIEGRMVPPVVGVTLLKFDPFDAVGETYAKLNEIRTNKAKCRLSTSLTEYTDMYLAHVGSPRTEGDGSGATFQLTFQQVRKVSPLSVEAPAIPLEPNGAPKKNRGGIGAAVVNSDEEAHAKRRSAAAALIDGASGLLGL